MHSRDVQVMPFLKRGTLRVTLQTTSQGRSPLSLPAVFLLGVAEALFDLLKSYGVHNEISLGGEVFDFAKGAHDALEEGRMCSEKAG